MGITPMDIQNKEFERSFRGYDIEDVDDFLDRVAKELEELLRENTEMKDQVSHLQEKNKNYQKLEGTMHNAIVVAQETAEEVKQNAKREADLIRREAEKDAQRIVEDARYRSGKILAEQEELFKQARVFRMRFRSFIEAQLSSLESEDWLQEAQYEQEAGGLKKGYEPRGQYESQTESQPGPEFRQSLDYSSMEDYDSKPDFEPKPDNDLNFDFEPEPEPEPKPDPDYGSKTGYRPKRNDDDDFDADPDF